MKRERGENIEPLNKWLEEEIEKINKKAIERTKPTTPPNLLGIQRKIAYAKRKYHSGWIWIGVTKGLAGIKFSASINE